MRRVIIGLFIGGAALLLQGCVTSHPVDPRPKASFEASAALGSYRLGLQHAAGNGVPKDLPLAALHIRNAADLGLPQAQATLGLMYESGKGVERDLDAARAHYRQAAEQGNPQGQRRRASFLSACRAS